MKKFLALFLLASSVFAQQQVQPVAGVLTLNLVPGTTAFKVILSANVTSVVIVNPTPGTIISVIFTENATGGFTVAFGGNIANPCTITTTANATTVCQFQYDSTSNTWNGISGGGAASAGTPQQAAIRLSTQCPTTDTNCFLVNQDGQVSVSSTWSANTSNGTTATLLTIGDLQSGAQYLQASTPQSNIGGIFSSTSGNNASILGAFKIAGTLGVPASCPGTSNNAASATTVSQAITPASSGSGSILIAFATEGAVGAPDEASITLSDNNGNTWNNVISRPLVYGGNESVQMAYVQNNNSGATTVTATFATSATFRTLTVCNFSGMASSNVLDAAAWGISSSGTIYAGTVTTTGNDLLIQFGRSQVTFPTFTVGTLAIAANTITNGSSDPVWTSANVGQKIVGGSGCVAANGFINCVSPFINPSVKIVAVNGPHNISINSLLNAANTAPDAHGFTGWLITAHDDGAQYAAAMAKAVTIPGSTLFLPCGTTIIGQEPFNGATSAPFPVWNPNIVGCASGETGTVLVPAFDFNYAAATGAFIVNVPNNNSLFSGGPATQNESIYGQIRDFAIWGIAGEAGSGQNLPIINAANAEITNVDATGFQPSNAVGANFISGQSVRLNNVHCWICGPIGLTYTGDNGFSAEPGSVRNSYFQGNGISIIVNGGHLESSNNSLYGNNGNCSVATSAGVQVNGGQFTSRQDFMAGLSITAGTANIEDTTNTATGCAGDLYISGGVLTAHRARIDSIVSMSSGTLIDFGGNYHTAAGTPWTTGSLTITGGTVVGTGSVTGVAITAPKLALSAGWGTTAAWTSLSGFTKRVQGTLTASGTGQAANPTITYTFPTPFAQATNIICKASQIGGTQTAVANPFTVGVATVTSVVFTYTGTPGAGNTLQIILECDAL